MPQRNSGCESCNNYVTDKEYRNDLKVNGHKIFTTPYHAPNIIMYTGQRCKAYLESDYDSLTGKTTYYLGTHFYHNSNGDCRRFCKREANSETEYTGKYQGGNCLSVILIPIIVMFAAAIAYSCCK